MSLKFVRTFPGSGGQRIPHNEEFLNLYSSVKVLTPSQETEAKEMFPSNCERPGILRVYVVTGAADKI
jgi:hypothetical protein